MCYEEMLRPLEAIECLKRALLGADPSEIQIKLKLARLYDDIEDREAAVRNHQLVINICMTESEPGSSSPSYSVSIKLDRSTNTHIRSKLRLHCTILHRFRRGYSVGEGISGARRE